MKYHLKKIWEAQNFKYFKSYIRLSEKFLSFYKMITDEQ